MPAEKLNARKVDAIKKPGRYSDGCNLYLQVTPSGGKSWALLYTLNGRHRQMGLGALEFLPLSEARDAALEARRVIRQGIDPIEARRATTTKPAAPTRRQGGRGERLERRRKGSDGLCREKVVRVPAS